MTKFMHKDGMAVAEAVIEVDLSKYTSMSTDSRHFEVALYKATVLEGYGVGETFAISWQAIKESYIPLAECSREQE